MHQPLPPPSTLGVAYVISYGYVAIEISLRFQS